MSKREYTGPPIDLTDGPGETHLSQSNGKTVAGTTDDDLHEEETESWPSALEKDDFTPAERKCIELLALQPDTPYSAVTDAVGCSDTVLYNARQKIKEQDAADDVPFELSRNNKSSQTDENTTETGESTDLSAKDWFIKTMANHPSESASEITARVPDGKGWSIQNYYNVMREGRGAAELKAKLVENGNWENAHDTIQEKLADVSVSGADGDNSETETESEDEEDPTDDTRATNDSSNERVAELEKTVSTLVEQLAGDTDSGAVVGEIVAELDDADVAAATTEVVLNE